MISKIWNGVCGVVGRTPIGSVVVAGVFALLMFVGGAEVFAQGGGAESVTFTPIVDFGTLFEQLRGPIATIVAAALGLGLAIWAARYVFSIIKSMGR